MEELEAVMTFIHECSKAKEVDDQIHVIWYVFIVLLDVVQIQVIMCSGSALIRMYHALCCH